MQWILLFGYFARFISIMLHVTWSFSCVRKWNLIIFLHFQVAINTKAISHIVINKRTVFSASYQFVISSVFSCLKSIQPVEFGILIDTVTVNGVNNRQKTDVFKSSKPNKVFLFLCPVGLYIFDFFLSLDLFFSSVCQRSLVFRFSSQFHYF